MNLEEKVLLAQNNDSIRNEIIHQYKNFITSCAEKTVGRYVTAQDDELSIAMIAFNEAITKFQSEKGLFLSFAKITIRNRLIDYIRKEKGKKSIPFSELSQWDQDGDEIAFDIEDEHREPFQAKFEIQALSEELKGFGISFFDLPKVTPKTKKTRSACFSVIQYIMENPIMIYELRTNKVMPIKAILNGIKVKRKLIERHRNYIITAIIILTGEYEILREYFREVKEGRRI